MMSKMHLGLLLTNCQLSLPDSVSANMFLALIRLDRLTPPLTLRRKINDLLILRAFLNRSNMQHFPFWVRVTVILNIRISWHIHGKQETFNNMPLKLWLFPANCLLSKNSLYNYWVFFLNVFIQFSDKNIYNYKDLAASFVRHEDVTIDQNHTAHGEND